MMLKELETGKRFEFEDKKTALLEVRKSNTIAGRSFPPVGTFKYLAVGQWGWAKLLQESTGEEIIVIAATHFRHVIPIF
jgi:hypothetical protein